MHWLQGSIPADRIGIAVATLENALQGSVAEPEPYGRHSYDRGYSFEPYAAAVWYDSSDERCAERHGGRACVAIPGAALDSLTVEQQWRLVRRLVRDCWMRGTRVDAAYDDVARIKEPWELAELAAQGKFTGYRRWEHRSPRRRNGTREGDAVEFGRRGKNGSGRFLRVYDKALESDGEIDAVRWEVEFTKGRAARVVFALSEAYSPEVFLRLLGQFIGGAIDWLDRGDRPGDRNLGRLERLPWWGQIRKRLGAVAVTVKRQVMRVERARAWIECQVASTLAMLQEAIGPSAFGEWVEGLTVGGRKRMRNRHTAAIDAWHRQDGWPAWVTAGA